MNEKHKMLDNYLIRIASNLDISETMREKAKSSYRAVGKWLGDYDEASEVKIMPQGSFYLGTVIRPVSDADEYDIDLVCMLKNEKNKSLYEIKNIVGDRLKENKTYNKMLQEEGKRCWTLCYDEFHMDILPCVPNNSTYSEPYLTELKLTHKLDNNIYIPKYSNPYKYHEWFEKMMESQVVEARQLFAKKNNVEIDKIPLYRIKTPLQRAIQLLKRHRDVMYDKLPESRKKNAPISIIITTLAAHAYENESSIYEALNNIVSKMESYIEKDKDGYKILNPVMPQENFADKWNVEQDKAKEFFIWLQCAKNEIITNLINSEGLHVLTKNLEICFGENIVKRSIIEDGNAMKEARDNSSLYVNGLKGGLQTSYTDTSKKVGGHTFFGK